MTRKLLFLCLLLLFQAFPLFAQEPKKPAQQFIFTKYVLLNEKEVTIAELQAKSKPAEDLMYMYAIEDSQKASQFYAGDLGEEGVTLVYTLDFGSLWKVLAKYGIILKTKRKGKEVRVDLVYNSGEAFTILLMLSKLKQDDYFEPMQIAREYHLKVGENKMNLSFETEENAKDYFLWIIEPKSNTDPNPGAFHFIRLSFL